MIKIWHNHLVVKVINNIVQKLQALLGLMVIWSGSIITSRRLSFCMYLWTLHRGLDITLVTLGFRSQEKIPFVTLSEESITTYMYTTVFCHHMYQCNPLCLLTGVEWLSRVSVIVYTCLWGRRLAPSFYLIYWSFTFRFQDSHIYHYLPWCTFVFYIWILW